MFNNKMYLLWLIEVGKPYERKLYAMYKSKKKALIVKRKLSGEKFVVQVEMLPINETVYHLVDDVSTLVNEEVFTS